MTHAKSLAHLPLLISQLWHTCNRGEFRPKASLGVNPALEPDTCTCPMSPAMDMQGGQPTLTICFFTFFLLTRVPDCIFGLLMLESGVTACSYTAPDKFDSTEQQDSSPFILWGGMPPFNNVGVDVRWCPVFLYVHECKWLLNGTKVSKEVRRRRCSTILLTVVQNLTKMSMPWVPSNYQEALHFLFFVAVVGVYA